MNISRLSTHSLNGQIVLFEPSVGPYQVLPHRVRVDQVAIAMKWYTTLPKAPWLEPDLQIFFSYPGHFLRVLTDMQPVYSAVLADWFLIDWILWHIDSWRLFKAKSFLHIYIKYLLFVCICQSLNLSRMWLKGNFYADFIRFEFDVFLLFNWFLYQGRGASSLSYYFSHSWKKKSWIHTFPMSIRDIWNVNRLN